MNIPFSLHPFELARHSRLFFKQFLGDFELRFMETRKRLALELQVHLSPEDRVLFEDLIRNLTDEEQKPSITDFSELMEVHEQTITALCLSRISDTLDKMKAEDQWSDKVRARLMELQYEFRQEQLRNDPGFLELIKYRWRHSALRDEADYFVRRAEGKSLREEHPFFAEI